MKPVQKFLFPERAIVVQCQKKRQRQTTFFCEKLGDSDENLGKAFCVQSKLIKGCFGVRRCDIDHQLATRRLSTKNTKNAKNNNKKQFVSLA